MQFVRRLFKPFSVAYAYYVSKSVLIKIATPMAFAMLIIAGILVMRQTPFLAATNVLHTSTAGQGAVAASDGGSTNHTQADQSNGNAPTNGATAKNATKNGTSPTVAQKSVASKTSASVTAPTSTTPALILSSSSVTLPKTSATSGGTVEITITSNSGVITEPIGSDYAKAVAIETTGTPPYDTILRTQWKYRVQRIEQSQYGNDTITFTAKTSSGKVIQAQLKVTIEPIPSFTVTKGDLQKVFNSDGTVTYIAHFTLNPGPYFGNPQLHMCTLITGHCDVSQDFTYNGNNNLSMSKTITPFPSGDIHAHFDMNIAIDGWYTNGSANMNWQDNY